MKKWVGLFGEILLVLTIVSCLKSTYAIYWGGALAGTYEYGLIGVFLGWIPGLIGLILTPFCIFLAIWVVKAFQKK